MKTEIITGNLTLPSLFLSGGCLTGEGVRRSSRTLGELSGLFEDEAARAALPADTLVYEVYSHMPVDEGRPGGLFFGLTRLFAGKVGREYFMTRGHFHRQADRTEYYWCLEGEGALLLMDEARQTRAERMFPGSLHHIPGGFAHRVANIGRQALVFAASWPSDAGHDYRTLAAAGFEGRLLEVDGIPQICF
ncbi:MAG: cupin domain-containing protein [Tannerella sp.]|jgi:glucose-6-phosphate isomerase|nr:cupin domain-containing protein [Tannerella sp.]